MPLEFDGNDLVMVRKRRQQRGPSEVGGENPAVQKDERTVRATTAAVDFVVHLESVDGCVRGEVVHAGYLQE